MKKNSWDYKKMNEIEILLEKEIDSDLGSRNKIEELYKNIEWQFLTPNTGYKKNKYTTG